MNQCYHHHHHHHYQHWDIIFCKLTQSIFLWKTEHVWPYIPVGGDGVYISRRKNCCQFNGSTKKAKMDSRDKKCYLNSLSSSLAIYISCCEKNLVEKVWWTLIVYTDCVCHNFKINRRLMQSFTKYTLHGTIFNRNFVVRWNPLPNGFGHLFIS